MTRNRDTHRSRRIASQAFLLLVVVSIILTPVSAPAAADTSESYSIEWTGILSGTYHGAAMDSNGDVYVINDSAMAKYDGDTGNLICDVATPSGISLDGDEDALAVAGHHVYAAGEDAGAGEYYAVGFEKDCSASFTLGLDLYDEFLGTSADQVENIRAVDGGIYDYVVFLSEEGNMGAMRVDSVGLDNYYAESTSGAHTAVNVNSSGHIYRVVSSGDRVRFVDYDPSQSPANSYGGNNWITNAGEPIDGIRTLVHNDSGAGTDPVLATDDGQALKMDITSSDTINGELWNFSYSSTGALVSAYDRQREMVVIGDGSGTVDILNATAGNLHESKAFGDISDIAGVAAYDGNIVAVQSDGSIRYWSIPSAGPTTPTPTPTATATATATSSPTASPTPGIGGFGDQEWSNWDNMDSGERMTLILSDLTILWLLASLLVSVGLAVRFKATTVGLGSFGSLSVFGWILGFVPNYLILSLIIFYLFILFATEINFSTQSSGP